MCSTWCIICIDDLGVDQSDIMALSMKIFVSWCNEKDFPRRCDTLISTALKDEGVELSEDACESVAQLFSDPWMAAAILTPIWPAIILQHREPPKVPLAFVQVTFALGFRDGTLVCQNGVAEVPPGENWPDSFAFMQINKQCMGQLNLAMQQGLDVLREQYGKKFSEFQSPLGQPSEAGRSEDIPPNPLGL